MKQLLRDRERQVRKEDGRLLAPLQALEECKLLLLRKHHPLLPSIVKGLSSNVISWSATCATICLHGVCSGAIHKGRGLSSGTSWQVGHHHVHARRAAGAAIVPWVTLQTGRRFS